MSQMLKRIFGALILLCGGVLMGSLIIKLKSPSTQPQGSQQESEPLYDDLENEQANAGVPSQGLDFKPLSIDVETEAKLLAAQQQERDEQARLNEQKTLEYARAQKEAEQQALAKAAAESGNLMNEMPPTETVTPEIDPEIQRQIEENARAVAEVERAGLESQAQKDRAAEAKKAQQEREAKEEAAAKEKARLEAKAKAEAEAKAKAEKAKKDIAADISNGRKPWMVQVGLVRNEEETDKIVKGLKAKGYKVTKSQTSKGIRILVGDENSKEDAQKILRKIQSDTQLGIKDPWVIHWQPVTP